MKNNQLKNELQEYLSGIENFKTLSESAATEWFNENLISEKKRKRASQSDKENSRKSVKTHKVSKPTPGRMYQFGYDAKTAANLPYWDKYPLIICLSVTGTHFQGVNLHYIPPKERETFLDIIMKYSSTKTTSNSTYLKIDYNKIKNIKWVAHMLKLYLFSQVREVFQEIAPKDWGKAIKLPSQQFTYKDTGKNISATAAYNQRNKT